MAESIVDVLEVVQVDEQKTDARAVLVCILKGSFESVLKKGAVWEAGQRVMVGRSPDLRLCLLVLADIEGDAYNPVRSGLLAARAAIEFLRRASHNGILRSSLRPFGYAAGSSPPCGDRQGGSLS